MRWLLARFRSPPVATSFSVALAAGAGALAFALSAGPGELWPLAWIAPLPVLLLARRGPLAAGVAAFAAYAVGALPLITIYSALIPPPALAVFLMVPAAAFAASVLATGIAFRRLPAVAASLVFPALWTSCEFLTAQVSPNGTFGSLAYSQTDLLPLLQLAAVTGAPGITFVLTLVPSVLAVAAHRRSEPVARVALIAVAAVLTACLGIGWVRLLQAPDAAKVRVGLAASDAAMPVLEAYARRARTLAASGAHVIVMPEKLVGVRPAYAGAARRLLGDAARASRAWIVAGLNEWRANEWRNVAVVFNPTGEVALEYEKVHLVPGLESSYRRGAEVGLFGAAAPRWGVAICKDLDFPAHGRRYAAALVGILFVPAWDFVADGRLHARMAVMRGVEGGYAVARAAQEGLLTVSDARGRIVAEKASAESPEALLVAEVSPGEGQTIYARFGDWFGWLVVVLAAALLIRSIGRRAAYATQTPG